MRELLPARVTMGRVRVSRTENRNDERNATYIVVEPKGGRQLTIVLSDKNGWDRCDVSVYNSKRFEPNAVEIGYVRELIFTPEEIVYEFHMKPKGYINVGHSTRTLWRKQEGEVEMPPLEML